MFLRQIIRESVREHLKEYYKKIDKSKYEKFSKDLFDFISNNEENIIKNAKEKTIKKPYITKDFNAKKYDNPISEIGFYEDIKDNAEARYEPYASNILFNISKIFDVANEYDLENIIHHEIIHSYDPKVKDERIQIGASKLVPDCLRQYKKDKDYKKLTDCYEKAVKDQKLKGLSFEKYNYQPWEFEANSSTIIDKLINGFEYVKPEFYKKYINLLKDLFIDIKTKTVIDIVYDKKYEIMPWFFSRQKDDNAYNLARQNFADDLNVIKTYTEKPTFYKKFLTNLFKELNNSFIEKKNKENENKAK